MAFLFFVFSNTCLFHTDRLAEFLSQMQVCASSVQTCAEHQKCMTDDVLELSRLRAHKVLISNNK